MNHKEDSPNSIQLMAMEEYKNYTLTIQNEVEETALEDGTVDDIYINMMVRKKSDLINDNHEKIKGFFLKKILSWRWCSSSFNAWTMQNCMMV